MSSPAVTKWKDGEQCTESELVNYSRLRTVHHSDIIPFEKHSSFSYEIMSDVRDIDTLLFSFQTWRWPCFPREKNRGQQERTEVSGEMDKGYFWEGAWGPIMKIPALPRNTSQCGMGGGGGSLGKKGDTIWILQRPNEQLFRMSNWRG